MDEKELIKEESFNIIGSLIPSNCPWSEYLPGTISFCEERLCAWVVEPANTWSNIGYLIAGVLIALHSQKERDDYFNFFSLTAIYLFIGSSLFHATGTFWGEYLDVTAMFMFSLAMLSINIKRFFKVRLKTAYTIFAVGFFLSCILLYLVKPIGIPLFAGQVVAALSLEAYLFKYRKHTTSYAGFFKALAFFAGAFFFWILDVTKIACWPGNHIFTGHSAWHLLNAFTIYYLYMFYMPLIQHRKLD